MVRWFAVAILLASAGNGWGSGGGAELQREEGIRRYWQLLGKVPETAEAVREAALQAAVQGEARLCQELIAEGAAQFPEQAGLLHFELGGAMSRLGKLKAAEAAFEMALEKRKGLRVSFAYLALATLYERQGNLAHAWKVFQDLVADEDALAIHLVEASAFALRHGKEGAQRLFEQAMEKNANEGLTGPGQEPLAADIQRAASVAADLNLQEPCESLFRDGMRQHPESLGWFQYEFGVALERFGRVDEALELFRAARKEPSGLKVSFAYSKLASLLEKAGKADEAAQVYGELLGSKEAMPPHVAEAGSFEARHGRVERGLDLYLEAFRRCRREEEQIAVGNVLSEGAASLPGLKELAEWFRTRTETLAEADRKRIRRALATTFGNHAWKLLNEKAFADAGTAAEMALVIYAPDVLTWVEGNRAHAYLFQGRLPEAREIHERYRGVALELDGLDWNKAAREDFKSFRESGLVTPEVEREMRKLESLLELGQAPAGRPRTAN